MCAPGERYKKGGYHPVAVGQTYSDGWAVQVDPRLIHTVLPYMQVDHRLTTG